MRKKLELSGKKFGRLTVLKMSGIKNSHTIWECKCDCGNIINAVGSNLKIGETKSCGCLTRGAAKQSKNLFQPGENNMHYKHGLSQSKRYKCHMTRKRKARIKNQKSDDSDFSKIIFLYSLCKYFNSLKIGKYVVDHIKPLAKNGKHHERNLQIIPDKLNCSKGKRWPLTKQERIKYRGLTLRDIEWGLDFSCVNYQRLLND